MRPLVDANGQRIDHFHDMFPLLVPGEEVPYAKEGTTAEELDADWEATLKATKEHHEKRKQ